MPTWSPRGSCASPDTPSKSVLTSRLQQAPRLEMRNGGPKSQAPEGPKGPFRLLLWLLLQVDHELFSGSALAYGQQLAHMICLAMEYQSQMKPPKNYTKLDILRPGACPQQPLLKPYQHDWNDTRTRVDRESYISYTTSTIQTL